MAHLGTKTSDGQLSFDKYVKDNPKWSSGMKFLVEHGSLAPIVDIKINKPIETDVVLTGGQEIHIMSQSYTILSRSKYVKIKIAGGSGTQGYLNIRYIRKPTSADVMKAETRAIQDLDKAIKRIQIPATIIVDRSSGSGQIIAHNIVEARKVGGVPKADFALHDKYGVPQMWISHKKEGDATAFQQYSGISEKSGTALYQHSEVKQFMRKVTQHLEGEYTNEKELRQGFEFLTGHEVQQFNTKRKGIVLLNNAGHQNLARQISKLNPSDYSKFLKDPQNFIDWGEITASTSKLSYPLYSRISSKALKTMAMFGSDTSRTLSSGGVFGSDNVQVIGQGAPILTPVGDDGTFNLSFSSHTMTNEDEATCSGTTGFDCSYEPVFVATYRAGRGFTVDNQTYFGARLGIAPIAMVRTRHGIKEI